MASIIPIGSKFRAQIRRAGQKTLTKTFNDVKDAEIWALTQEREIEMGNRQGSQGRLGMTVAEAIERYKLEKNPTAYSVLHTLDTLKSSLGTLRLEKLTDDIVVEHFLKRKTGASTNQVHFSFLKAILRRAKIGWGYHVPEVMKPAEARLTMLEKLAPSTARNRRPTDSEIQRLINYDYSGDIPMSDIIMFAINSSMRQAEITRIERVAYNKTERTQLIRDRKHPKKKKGNHQTVPLLDSALEIIDRQIPVEGDDRIFPFRAQTICAKFSAACKALGIVDLHFHDLRHEGTSRLFEMGYKIEEVQLFTGHQDWKMLKRYTHLKAKDVRRLETKKEKEAKQEERANEVTSDPELMKEFEQFLKMKKMMAMMNAGETA